MKKQIRAFMEDKFPVLFYRLLRVKRHMYENVRKKMSLEEIKADDARMYFEHTGHHVNWDEPAAYTEKMQLEKLFHNYPLKTMLTDKYRAREWVAKKVGEKYLVPLCGKGVYDSPYDIDFSELPNQFVIKTNLGSGDATIVRDKSLLSAKDIRRIKAKINYYLHFDFSWLGYEFHYSDIEPKVLVEQLIECEDEDLPDYKFLCFDGKPLYCWVDKGRYHNHKRNIYDMDWNLQSWNQRDYGNYEGVIDKPEKFDEMVEIATKLAEGFQHVRVDLYNVKGKIYFGEMTFTNGMGFEPIIPYEADLMLGKLWNLDFQSGFDQRK